MLLEKLTQLTGVSGREQTRNGHSPTSIIDMKDVNECIRLISAFVKEEYSF